MVAFAVGGREGLGCLREMTWMFPITLAATVLLLFAGTRIFPDRPEERAEVEGFFRRISSPGGGKERT